MELEYKKQRTIDEIMKYKELLRKYKNTKVISRGGIEILENQS